MTDRAEAPAQVTIVHVDHPVGCWIMSYAGCEGEVAYVRADLAAQERDAAVAAALEEVQRTLEQWGEHQAIGCIRALPRNADALRLHEAKLLREQSKRAKRLCTTPGGFEVCEGCAACEIACWLEDEANLRDEAAQREGT